jgi:SAM-dependent methyltransferase
MVEKSAYTEAVRSGKYEKPSGLIGKYDNVRRFWEDEVIRIFLSPYLERLMTERDKLRILDLGCGSGDGYEVLNGVKRIKGIGVSEHNLNVITPETLEVYKGIDINPNLIAQAEAIYSRDAKLAFREVNFNNLPSELDEEPPYDLYFANYGTLSHNTDEQTVKLLSSIAQHGRDGSIVLCDWLGRYCYEWQTLWTKDMEQNKTIDYVISYIYSDGEKDGELSSFPLRLLSREEALAIIEESGKQTGVEIEVRELFDRSIFMGRHIDTAQYNPFCRPVRRVLNSLLEPNVRTDLDELAISYVPKEGFPRLNEFYKRLEGCWNALVSWTIELVQHFDAGRESLPIPMDVQEPVLRKAMLEMERTVRDVGELNIADSRANIIEPQLCYGLRELEMRVQEGEGCGHGLVAILELHK